MKERVWNDDKWEREKERATDNTCYNCKPSCVGDQSCWCCRGELIANFIVIWACNFLFKGLRLFLWLMLGLRIQQFYNICVPSIYTFIFVESKFLWFSS